MTGARSLALVVQRYAEDIGGGSELHARYIAEHLSARANVRVLTTCARDYVSWKNEYPAGETRINGIPVERFPVARERDARDFARLIARVGDAAREVDFVVLFSVRYHSAFHGA